MSVIVGIDGDAVYDMSTPFLIVLFMPWCLGTYNDRTPAIVGLVTYLFLGQWCELQVPETTVADYFFVSLFVVVPWLSGVPRQPPLG